MEIPRRINNRPYKRSEQWSKNSRPIERKCNEQI